MTSRKITPIFVACVISLGLIFFAVTKDRWTMAKTNTYEAEKNTAASGIQLAVQKAIEDSAERDSDGDGIKDWEESFKKSADANAVTSADPKNKNVATAAASGTSNETLTTTDEIGRGLFSEYMQLKQSGRLNQDTMTNLVNKAVAQADMNTVNLYSPSNIKTIPDSDINGAKNYANSLVSIREKYKDQYRANQIIIVGKTINFDDPASVESISSTSKLYESITKELAGLLVPKSLVAAHVALLNNYSESFIGLQHLSHVKDDPILALVGIQKHVASANQESEILSGMSQFFATRGLVFSTNEPGSRIGNI